jgi:hypothetical protein
MQSSVLAHPTCEEDDRADGRNHQLLVLQRLLLGAGGGEVLEHHGHGHCGRQRGRVRDMGAALFVCKALNTTGHQPSSGAVGMLMLT